MNSLQTIGLIGSVGSFVVSLICYRSWDSLDGNNLMPGIAVVGLVLGLIFLLVFAAGRVKQN